MTAPVAAGPDPVVRIDADLTFSVEVDGDRMEGTVRSFGGELELRVSDPYLLGGSGSGPARALARELADRGIRLRVVDDRPLVTLGVPRASFVQRRLTGSAHIRVASLSAALRLLRLRRVRPGDSRLVPPGSPLPLLPTLLRRPRRPTLTHDPDRGGYPRLVMAPGPHPRPGDRQPVFPLGDRTTIGGHPSCDIVLDGLAPLHAEVRRTDGDEFVVRPLGGPAREGGQVRVHGAVVATEALLRTGTRIDVGSWTLTYAREEYADHGRPYGGRLGGELGRQRPQPSWEELDRGR
jgi:hypothetical protein